MRRWPEELDLPIDAVLPPSDLDPKNHDLSQKLYTLPSGQIQAISARLKIGEFDKTVPLAPVRSWYVSSELPAGPVELQTWLTDASGRSWGAYYVDVTRLKAED